MKITRYTFTGRGFELAVRKAEAAALLAVDADRVMLLERKQAKQVLRITGDVPAELDRDLLALGASKTEQ